MRNRAVCIGYLGSMSLYLNIPKDEAIRRYSAAHKDRKVSDLMVDEFWYDDEIEVYSAGPVKNEDWIS